MPSKYQIISEMAAREAARISSGAGRYMAFLETAANNYKYTFREQLLIHNQKPDATACAEIGTWNKLGRWVNKGTHGIALLVDRQNSYKVRYVFDISDTNSRDGFVVNLWQLQRRFEDRVMVALENRFGPLDEHTGFPNDILSIVNAIVEDNLTDYAEVLRTVKDGSLLEELDDLNTEVWLKSTVKSSVAFMVLTRCGYDARRYFTSEDFSHVYDFNTVETISVLGDASSDISEMVLREIEVSVRALQKEEKYQNRTFANAERTRDNVRINEERSVEHGREADVPAGGRLLSAQRSTPGESEGRQVWDAAARFPAGSPETDLHRDAPEREAEQPLGGDRPAGDRDGGTPDGADGEAGGRDGEPESVESDVVGTVDEQHPEPGGGIDPERSHLQLAGFDLFGRSEIPYYHYDAEKQELIRESDALKDHRVTIAAYFADHEDRRERGNFLASYFNNTLTESILSNGQRAGYRAFRQGLHLYRGGYMNPEMEANLRWTGVASIVEGMIVMGQWLDPDERPLPSEAEQMSLIQEERAENENAFVMPQEAIDYVLTGGSGVHEGKYRILEQFEKGESTEENVKFLKSEYGVGGRSDAIPGTGIWEDHDSKGILLRRTLQGDDKKDSLLLKWPTVEKRIRELIAVDRYLNSAEKAEYPAFQHRRGVRMERRRVADEFRSLINEYEGYVKENHLESKLADSSYVISCASPFSLGEKKNYIRAMNGDFILPLMREAMQTIIADNTPLTERCEAMLSELTGPLAMGLEPTEEELNPPPPPKMELVISLGDTVYIGSQEYDVLSLGDEVVELSDPQFPLFNKEFPRADFERMVMENPMNAKYLREVEEEPEQVEPAAQGDEKPAEKKYDLGYGAMGNGLTVWNRLETVNGDYRTVAVINEDRSINFYDPDMPENVMQQIREVAETAELTVSATQDTPVFTTPPQMPQNEAGGNDLWQEYNRIRSEHNGAIVLYQVGDFYEVLDEDARIVAEALDIGLTTRNVGLKERVPMCGVPVAAKDTPLVMLNDRGYDVVVVDDEHQLYPLPSHHKDKPIASKPVARVDYLGSNGEVGYSIEYTDAEQFVRDTLDDNHNGVAMSVVVYRDKDGNTIPTGFADQFDPPPQGYEVRDYESERPETSLDRAKKLIDEYCEREFGHGGDYENLAHVDIGYTEVEDEEISVQIVADLINCRIDRYLDKRLVDRREYDSVEDLISNELDGLDFAELITFTDAQLDEAKRAFTEPTGERFHVVEVVRFNEPTFYSVWDDQSDGYYVDEGIVEEFSSEFQANEYCRQLNEGKLVRYQVGDIIQIGEDDQAPEYRVLKTKRTAYNELNTPVTMYGFDAYWDKDLQHFKFSNTDVLRHSEPIKVIGRTLAARAVDFLIAYNPEENALRSGEDAIFRMEEQLKDPLMVSELISQITLTIPEEKMTPEQLDNANRLIADLTAVLPEMLRQEVVTKGSLNAPSQVPVDRTDEMLRQAMLAAELSERTGQMVFGFEEGNPLPVNVPQPTQEIGDGDDELLPEEIPAGQEAEYRLLHRLDQDCRYYLGNGLRAEKHLWAGSVPAQIAKMRELYEQLREKPIWLDRETIDRYEREMTGEPKFPGPATEDEQRAFDAMVKAGFRYDESASNAWTKENIVFRDAIDYPITFENWNQVYEWIDGAELKDTPGLREEVQKILHPEPAEKEIAPPPPAARPRRSMAPSMLYPNIPNAQRHDYRIVNDQIGVGTPSVRYANNVAAIRLLKQLEAEQRLATPQEQEVLAQYVGWGGLADSFDERNSHYLELKELLDENEYTAARESTLTAFYTPPVVIRAMYQALENMGFKSGNLLEPSCGIGNFIGMKPESLADSRIYGVELDSISGRIAQQLYQTSSIAVQGFEKTELPDSFFDVAIGNIPFGNFKLIDKRYDKHNFLIHDYFFAKTLDRVRPGGIVAFVTSKGTMDKESPVVRRYIAQRADLLGAIRLPNNTFKDAAGTDVTSDILFFQKRDTLTAEEPEWVHLNTDETGLKMNQYFIDHPDMVMGEMREISGPYGPETACVAYDGQDLGEMLSEAVQNITGSITEYEFDELTEEEEDKSIPADPEVRNFSYTLVEGEVYYRENSRMYPVELSMTAKNRVKGLIAIRDSVRQLIEYQTEDYPDEMITAEQRKLNRLYDEFSAKYGIINSRANKSAFNTDNSFFLLSSLEVLDDEGNFIHKADMFSKRTIKQRTEITHVDTATEALAVSLAEKAKVDMDYMMELTGKTEKEIFEDLKGVIFLNPMHDYGSDTRPKYLSADEYLSGNVREKLDWARRSAELYPDDYTVNVEALERVQPVDLTASEISVRLGSTWVPPEVFEEFMFELLDTPWYAQRNIKIHFAQITGEWNVEGKSYDRSSVKAFNTYGTDRINAYKIIEQTLNLKDVRIFDYVEDENGNKKPVLNKKETAIAQAKQEQIKQAFQDWIWKDQSRRERLCKLYNEKFNSIRPREYDGSHLGLVGINPEIKLRQHQLNAIARGLYGGNELLGHVVGAGKTFTMVAIAQESKRLGLCNKSLFVVPNHLTEQWSAEYLQLYPSANILVATAKDFEAKNRKRFCGRIATGEYDAIIIGHSQLEKIPLSFGRQCYYLEQQRDEIMEGIMEMKQNRGDQFSIKQLERSKKQIELKLEKLNDQSRKDDLVTFEELGIDKLFIDEAHYYKNLAAFTKMRNVGGISQTEAQKSSDLYMKIRYLDELTGGRGVCFATGTPISNTMVEMFTMQKYLQYNTLKRNGLIHFDSWASTFGETVTAIELAPEGTGYRAKTRFSRFFNLPELLVMFKEVADIQTADMLNLPVPKANYHSVVLKPSEYQKEMVDGLAERAEKVRNGMVNSSEDNMLVITNDGRKLALDQRLINEMLPESETGKVAACVQNVFDIWQRTSEQRSTQMVFCDFSTPHNDGHFNVYDAIRDKLIERGIPAEEIAYIHSAGTEAKKKELFGKVRSGQIRVLIGSTQKMGAGTNVQKKLIALHHLDCPWRPADLQQREGRIVRQGNENPEVDIFTYVTEGTFDAYLYQLVESKQKFIGQIMTSKSPVRSAEDIDETALSYAEIKALCSGNPKIKLKMDLDVAVSKLKLLKANHLSQIYSLESDITHRYPKQISEAEQLIEGYKRDIERRDQNTHPNEDGFSPMVVEGKTFTEKKAAGSAILEACKAMTSPDAVPLGQYRGFDLELYFEKFSKEYRMTISGSVRMTISLGMDIFGNIQRIDNALDGMETRMLDKENERDRAKNQLEAAKVEAQRPFPQEDELKEKQAQLDALNIELNMDKPENAVVDDDRGEGENETRSAKVHER